MEQMFLTPEDIDNLCDECVKDTINGKLAYIALISYLPSLESTKKYFKDTIDDYALQFKRWRIFLWLAIALCIYFCRRIPITHILFWVNIAFVLIGYFVSNYYKNAIIIFSQGYEKVSKQIKRIKKVLKSLKIAKS